MYSWMLIILSFIVLMVCVSNSKNIETFLEFIHIPKNAGTTIENIADNKGIRWGRFKPEHRDRMNTSKCLSAYWHVPPKHFYNNNYYDSDETFCVIRNPNDRLISEYSYIHKNDERKNNKENMNKWLKDNINEDNILKGRDNSNIRDYYCHLIPQYEYIYDDNGERTCDTILNFDNLNEDFNNLMKAKNIDLQLDDKTKENKSHFNLTVDDIDEENMKKIFKYYKKDFDIIKELGY